MLTIIIEVTNYKWIFNCVLKKLNNSTYVLIFRLQIQKRLIFIYVNN